MGLVFFKGKRPAGQVVLQLAFGGLNHVTVGHRAESGRARGGWLGKTKMHMKQRLRSTNGFLKCLNVINNRMVAL
jgi:hypothetical protein